MLDIRKCAIKKDLLLRDFHKFVLLCLTLILN